MPFTLSCEDVRGWPEDEPLKRLVLDLCGEAIWDGPERYTDNNQHFYDDISQGDIRAVLGPIAGFNDSLGLYVDMEPRTAGDVYLYSISRLVGEVSSRYPDLVARLGDQPDLVNALDAGTIDVSDEEYGVARLVANILTVSRHPVGGKPAVVLWW